MQSILVGLDGSADAARALEVAADLARASGAALHVAHVHHLAPYTELGGQMVVALEAADDEIDHELERQLAGIGVAHELHRIGPARPSDGLIDLAAELGAELIVVGTRGRSMPLRALLGSTAHELVSHAGCSVLIAR